MEHSTDCLCDRCLLDHMTAANRAARRRAWEAWYRRDMPALRAYIERRCAALRCPDDAEDILQDCFLIGFQNITTGHYRAQGSALAAYLVGIAKNRLREAVRLQRCEPVTLDELEASQSAGLSLDDGIARQIDLQAVADRVDAARAAQPPVYRRVVEGVYREGRTSQELAAELGKSAGTIRVIAHRAVHKIERSLARQPHLRLSAQAIRACLEAR